MKSSFLRKIIIGTFLSVPAISSVISTIHLIDLFNLGNPTWLSMLLAVTFELGSIASLLAISVIERIKVGAIWFIFFILSGLQIIGNVYYSYSFTSDQLLANPTFLTNFMDLFSFITGDELRDVKIFLSCIIGIPIPLIALFFLKSNIDYLRPEKKQEEHVSSKTESVLVETDSYDEPSGSASHEDMTEEEPETEVLTDDTEDFHVQQEVQEEAELQASDLKQSQETPTEENTIKRNRQKTGASRYVFDERGVRTYNA